MNHNIELIRLLYQHFSRSDFEAVKQLFAPDFTWQQMKGFPGGGGYSDVDEVIRNVFVPFRTQWTNWKAVTYEFMAGEQEVFVRGHYEGTFNETGKFLKADFLHLYRLKENRIVQFRQYTDTQLVAEAMRA